MSKNKKWTYTAGTEGTGRYATILKTRYGKLAVRDLGNTRFRVRVEPNEGFAAKLAVSLTSADGWKQPGVGGQNRFSKVVFSKQVLEMTLLQVKLALGIGRLVSSQNPSANVKVKAMVA